MTSRWNTCSRCRTKLDAGRLNRCKGGFCVRCQNPATVTAVTRKLFDEFVSGLRESYSNQPKL